MIVVVPGAASGSARAESSKVRLVAWARSTRKGEGDERSGLRTSPRFFAISTRSTPGSRRARFETVGNWSAAQGLNHLAAFMEYPFNGYLPEIVPGVVRAIR